MLQEAGKKIFSVPRGMPLPIKYPRKWLRGMSEQIQEKYIGELSKCCGILSGRFHGVCFAVQTRTPFLAVESNTPKISALLRELEMTGRLIPLEDIDRDISIPAFSVLELKRIEHYLCEARCRISQVFDQIFEHYLSCSGK